MFSLFFPNTFHYFWRLEITEFTSWLNFFVFIDYNLTAFTKHYDKDRQKFCLFTLDATINYNKYIGVT